VTTIVWLALGGTAVALEGVCHASRSRWTSATSIVRWLWRRLPGRIALLATWAFVGLHVFARYTLPT